MWATIQPPLPRCLPACPLQAPQGRQVAARAQKQKKAQRKRARQPDAEHLGGGEAARTQASQESTKDRQQRTSTSGKPIGWSFLPREDERWQPDEEPAPAPPQEGPAVVVDLVGCGGEPSGDADAPPVASRGQVFAACAQTAAAMGVGAWLLRARAADVGASALRNDPEVVVRLLSVPDTVAPASIAAALGAAAAVTAARQALLRVWPAFAAASQRTNRQVLTRLSLLDLLWVAAVPGISEEFLFRGALIPATFPDWRGALLAGALFGALHAGGGRNWAFAAWAAVVGGVYGAALLATGDVRVPMAAHTLANLAAAGLWKQAQGARPDEG